MYKGEIINRVSFVGVPDGAQRVQAMLGRDRVDLQDDDFQEVDMNEGRHHKLMQEACIFRDQLKKALRSLPENEHITIDDFQKVEEFVQRLFRGATERLELFKKELRLSPKDFAARIDALNTRMVTRLFVLQQLKEAERCSRTTEEPMVVQKEKRET